MEDDAYIVFYFELCVFIMTIHQTPWLGISDYNGWIINSMEYKSKFVTILIICSSYLEKATKKDMYKEKSTKNRSFKFSFNRIFSFLKKKTTTKKNKKTFWGDIDKLNGIDIRNPSFFFCIHSSLLIQHTANYIYCSLLS